eukprot:COSAG04_NODE_8696_length_941_cov_6.611639_1_plen_65_part_00
MAWAGGDLLAAWPMPYGDYAGEDAARYPLHAAAQNGRLADLRAGLAAKGAEGTLAAFGSESQSE